MRAELGTVSGPNPATVDTAAPHVTPAGDRNALFVDPRWLQCLQDAYGLRFDSLVIDHGFGTSAWLPFVEIDDVRGRRTVSLPFCDLIDTPVTPTDWRPLAAELISHGAPVLLLSWVPIIGDPLCVAAGWLRVHWLPALIFITVGKTARYAALMVFGQG